MRNTLDRKVLHLTSKALEPGISAFHGFKAPTSNTTYTPNQFFDVVIPNFSRGVVRIVAYLVRKTLGWCDANGNPQEEQIEVTYSELETKAGVSRDMIRGALDDALAGHLIECVTEGRAKHAHDAGQSARYQLCWSSAPYTTRLEDFRGFFEGEGNRTDIPNEFFDVLIPNEPLSVIKVVGADHPPQHRFSGQTWPQTPASRPVLSADRKLCAFRQPFRSRQGVASRAGEKLHRPAGERCFQPRGHGATACCVCDPLVRLSERSEKRTSRGTVRNPDQHQSDFRTSGSVGKSNQH
jgi:hypothetical protein